jgi:hypothetical protein
MFRGANITASSHVITVPAGLVYIVRDIDIVQVSAAPADMDVTGAVGQAFFYYNVANAQTPGPNLNWRGRQVVNEGEPITVSVFHGGFDVTISGYQLTPP